MDGRSMQGCVTCGPGVTAACEDAHPGDRLVRRDQLLSVISVAFFFMGENVYLVYFFITVDIPLL